MKNITLAVDDTILERARSLAVRQGTTLNAMVREFLEDALVQEEKVEEARRGLLELIDNSTGRLGPNFKWDRDAIYADREFPRHERTGLRGGREKG